MSGDNKVFDVQALNLAAQAELTYIRKLGSNKDLIVVSSNLGAYEALLIILCANETGVPVYEAVTNVTSRFSTQAGIINRINVMRKSGLLDERPGPKKSQVCLVPSPKLLSDLGPILCDRYFSVAEK